MWPNRTAPAICLPKSNSFSNSLSEPTRVHNPPRILIVDDNEHNRAILAARLGAQGYSTIEACDGVEALEAARRDAPDLILLDVEMPRSDESLGFVPVILVTPLRLEGCCRGPRSGSG